MSYVIRNGNSVQLVVVVEAWEVEFIVPPKATLIIKILQDKMGPLDTEVNADVLTVWLWGGCRAEVILDGKDVTPTSLSIPAPD